jgi:hypothetical protein
MEEAPGLEKGGAHYSEKTDLMKPEFPLRLIFDDGECVVIDSPEALLEEIPSIDSGDPRSSVWIRDALDRSVQLRVRNGVIEVLELIGTA